MAQKDQSVPFVHPDLTGRIVFQFTMGSNLRLSLLEGFSSSEHLISKKLFVNVSKPGLLQRYLRVNPVIAIERYQPQRKINFLFHNPINTTSILPAGSPISFNQLV